MRKKPSATSYRVCLISPLSLLLANSLAIACTSLIDDVSIFRLLLSRSNAVAGIADQNGALPLHLACQNQLSPSVVQLLVQAYPQAIEVEDRQGFTPKDITLLLTDGKRRNDLLQLFGAASRYVKRCVLWYCGQKNSCVVVLLNYCIHSQEFPIDCDSTQVPRDKPNHRSCLSIKSQWHKEAVNAKEH